MANLHVHVVTRSRREIYSDDLSIYRRVHVDRAAKLEVRSLGGSKGYVSGRCAAMIGGMCRFTRLRGRVPTRRRTKKKKKNGKRRKRTGPRGEEEAKARRRKDDGSAIASYNLMQRGHKGDYAHRWL